MLYLRFAPIALEQWNVIAPVKSAKPIAKVKRRKGQCSAAITAGRTLNREELAALLCFMHERDLAA